MNTPTQHTAEPKLVNLTLRPINEARRHSSGYIAFDDEPYHDGTTFICETDWRQCEDCQHQWDHQ